MTDDIPEPTEPASTEPAKKSDQRAFLPIGLAFLALGITFVIQEQSRGMGIAFFAVGITFLVLSLSGRRAGTKEPKDPAPEE